MRHHVFIGPTPDIVSCTNCGAIERLKLPMLVDEYTRTCREIIAKHESCGAVSSALPPLDSIPGLSLIPRVALELLGKVALFGQAKHGDGWRGVSLFDHVEHAQDHVLLGEGSDSESGLPSLAHAMCRLAFAVAIEAKEGKGNG